MFILLNRYLKPLEEVDRVLPAHRRFQDELYARGTFIASGRLEPRTGGVTLANAQSRSEIETILQSDPFVLEGVTEYQILEFVPTRYSDAFAIAAGLSSPA